MADKPIVEHILEKIKSVPEIKEILIVTNARFHHQFQVWLNHYTYPKKIKLINDGTISNQDRLGAVGDLNFVLHEEEINEDLLVIAGDNLFGFSVKSFLDSFTKKQKSHVALFDIKDKEKLKKCYGVALLDKTKIVNFEEKPAEPKSTLAATACYLFSKSDLKLVEQALKVGKADNPGDLVKHLVKSSEVHGYVFDQHWFDVGSFESLEKAEEVYKKL